MRRSNVDVELRPARPDDLVAIAEIYAHYVERTVITFDLEAPSESAWQGRWEAAQTGGYPWFSASEGSRLVGFLTSGEFNPRAAYRPTVATMIYLRPAARGRGIGRGLYELALPELRRAFHTAVAGITLPNPASVALHERVGFEPVGVFREVGHKHGGWHDVGWWQLVL